MLQSLHIKKEIETKCYKEVGSFVTQVVSR